MSVEQTLALVKQALQRPGQGINKAFLQPTSATTGLQYYDLEAPALSLYPVLTPLRNEIPRVAGRGGIQANWRAITGININKMSIGVSEGRRGGVIAQSTAEYLAAYRGIGQENTASFESTYAGDGFIDLRAEAGLELLQSVMIGEELVLLGGNGTVSVSAPAAPTLSAAAGGALPAETLSVICVALTLEGFYQASVAGGVLSKVDRVNINGKTDTYGGGSSAPSAAGSLAVTANQLVNASVPVVNGAVAYAWYWGTAGNETLGAITTINSVVITAAATGTQLASALDTSQDWSTNSLIFDGLMYQCFKPGMNALVQSMATGTPGVGTKLTPNSVGGVDEIDTDLQHYWDNYRLSPDEILVSAQEQKSITNAILSGSSSSAQRFQVSVDQGALVGGFMVKEYLNPFSMGGAKAIPIKLHPNMPAGTIMYRTKKLPYPLSNVRNLVQVRTRQDYYQLEWPLVEREYEYGVYADEVLQNYFPPAFGVRTNIAKG